MASTFGFGDRTLAADVTRLATGYAQESADALGAMMAKYKELACTMQVSTQPDPTTTNSRVHRLLTFYTRGLFLSR